MVELKQGTQRDRNRSYKEKVEVKKREQIAKMPPVDRTLGKGVPDPAGEGECGPSYGRNNKKNRQRIVWNGSKY